MALRDDDHVEWGDRPWMVERQHEVVLEHALDRRPPRQDVLAEPVALPALAVVRDVDVRPAHGATRARGARWQRGQWNVLRPPITVRRIEASQRSHGSPPRP